jgi:SulP family sulfate permease
MCPAVNEIDMSALESLEAINERLKALGVTFHPQRGQGPGDGPAAARDFLQHLTGKVFLSQHQAICELSPSTNQMATPMTKLRRFS